MEIELTHNASKDVEYWKYTNNINVQQKITTLLQTIVKDGPVGSEIGKSNALRYSLSGYCCRRIDKEHRLVYWINNNTLTIISLRFQK